MPDAVDDGRNEDMSAMDYDSDDDYMEGTSRRNLKQLKRASREYAWRNGLLR